MTSARRLSAVGNGMQQDSQRAARLPSACPCRVRQKMSVQLDEVTVRPIMPANEEDVMIMLRCDLASWLVCSDAVCACIRPCSSVSVNSTNSVMLRSGAAHHSAQVGHSR
ncbi:hypothetical protein NDU88_006819 [Pleurodeles waltl]|uniref:Uncharacterized protein n=1 Tax=Pleurodeles waltl TaxID=8319 RepID=A0AAV7SQS7_PLEWA|nr:hypothetical protein NDU88_006819 [Pleurodeles waltl]